jgi:Protein of unknown function (DUF2946)
MLGRLRRSVGQQFAATVLTFALVLQSVALAVAAGRPSDNAATDPNQAGFELCRHNSPASDDGDAAVPGGAPERFDAHCIFCLAGAPLALEAPISSAEFHVLILTILPWTLTAWRLPARTVDAGAWPRGPPPAA